MAAEVTDDEIEVIRELWKTYGIVSPIEEMSANPCTMLFRHLIPGFEKASHFLAESFAAAVLISHMKGLAEGIRYHTEKPDEANAYYDTFFLEAAKAAGSVQ